LVKNKKDKAAALDVELQFRDRRLLLEALKIVPEWVWGFSIWWLFSKLVLDRLSEKKPGTEINLAIMAGDFLPDWLSDSPSDLPPGVKLAALVDVTLTALNVVDRWPEYADRILRYAEKYPPAETGRPSPEAVGLLFTLQKYVIIGVGVITGVFTRKEWWRVGPKI
jgi:hypothetical protein